MIDFSPNPLPGNQPPTDAQKAQIRSIVGLGSVDNTSDATKPVSGAQQTALNLKANLASPTFTGTVSGVTASMVGLGNVTNTSDANKQVSSAQQAALDLKAPSLNPTFTGVVKAPAFQAASGNAIFTGNLTGTVTGNVSGSAASFTGDLGGEVTGKQNATAIAAATVTGKVLTGYASGTGTIAATDTILSAISKLNGNDGLKAPLASPTFTGTVSGVTQAMVGLGNVTNTSDANKPVSSAQQAALDLKANLASPSFSGTIQLPAGSSSAAPLKFTSGTSLTTAVFGAMEFDGTNLYLTNNVGTPARKTIAFTDSQLTTGSVGSSQLAAGAVDSSKLALNLTLAGTTTGSFSGALTGNASTATTATRATSFTGSLTGDVTGTQDATSIAAATVTGKVLTGYASGSGTIAASDTILAAIGKLNGNDGLKAPLVSPTFTGTVSAPTFSGNLTGNVSGSAASFTGALGGDVTGTQGATSIAATTVTSKVLTNLNNIATGDVTATDTILAAIGKLNKSKANLASPTFTGTVSGVTASMVGLGNVTNTSDANKPVSSAQQTALNLKANLASPTFLGTVQLDTGTNTAAPLKFNPGVLLTTPTIGAVEFSTDKLHVTTSTASGATRRALAFTDSPSFTGNLGADSIYATSMSANTMSAGKLLVSSGTPADSAIRLSTGALMTTPAIGAVEFTDTALYVTTGSNGIAARRKIAFNDYPSFTGIVSIDQQLFVYGNIQSTYGSLIANGVEVRGDSQENTFVTLNAPSSLSIGTVGNSGVGRNALSSLTTGTYNVAMGHGALEYCSSGNSNTAIGMQALNSAITAGRNTAIGTNALFSNMVGVGSVAVGEDALRASTTNGSNVAVGFAALFSNATGSGNVAVGTEALRTATNSSGNVAVGPSALRGVTTGFDNAGFGFWAGHDGVSGQVSIATGKRNTLLGAYTGTTAENYSQTIVLGYRATAQSSGELVIGAATSPIKAGTTGTIYNATAHGIDHTVTAPASPGTPVGWLNARINGILFKIPLYQ